MRRLILFLLALALLSTFRTPASAQMSNMPEDLRARLAEINPTWGKDILGNVATTLALYTPLLAAAPKDGVRIERDLAYGPDALHRLDLHKQEGRTGMPIVVFLHGGAYVRGSRSVNTEVYGNDSGRLKVSTSAERRAPSQALGPDAISEDARCVVPHPRRPNLALPTVGRPSSNR